MTALLRVVELFSGIGAQASALERAGIPHECVAVCEIDKYAYASYCAMHGNVPNLGDITKVEHLPDCDLLTYSFPCQDISVAGKRKGFGKNSGTRSGLLWNVERLLKEMKTTGRLPMTLLMENVDAITYIAYKKDFEQWISALADMGYSSSYRTLNAADYGIPQNRTRCFMVSRFDGVRFEFPKGIQKNRCLKDIIEKEVDERYYITEERMAKLILHRDRHKACGHGFGFSISGTDEKAKACKSRPIEEEDTLIQVAQLDGKHEQTGRVYSTDGCSPVVNTCEQPKIMVDQPAICIRNNTSQGYIEAHEGDGVILDQPDSKTKRGRVQEGLSPTVMTSGQVGTVDKMRIRCLTPRECWRVMDFSDTDYDKASSAVVGKRQMSECQLYKQAGNSICVGVLVAIFEKLYKTRQTVRQPMICEFGNIKETNIEVEQ